MLASGSGIIFIVISCNPSRPQSARKLRTKALNRWDTPSRGGRRALARTLRSTERFSGRRTLPTLSRRSRSVSDAAMSRSSPRPMLYKGYRSPRRSSVGAYGSITAGVSLRDVSELMLARGPVIVLYFSGPAFASDAARLAWRLPPAIR